jgi:PAS domain S-box-containing protein
MQAVVVRPHFQRAIWLGFLTAITIIAWLGITSYRNTNKSEITARWVSHANRVLFHSEQILALTIDLEAGQRGYALTGIHEFLEPTLTASERIIEHTKSLKEITNDNPAQQERITKLEKVVLAKIDFTRYAIHTRDTEGEEGARRVNSTMHGKKLTDDIRILINEVQEEETRLLDKRTKAVQAGMGRFNKYFIGMLFSTGIILMLLFYLIYVNLQARSKAEASLRLASERTRDIYDNAPCGYHSVNEDGIITEINNTWLDWLKYQRSEVVNRLRFEQLILAEQRADYLLKFEKFKQEGVVRDEEFTVTRKDGTTFPVLLNATGVYDEDKNFVKSRSTALDYTEQKKALQRIEQLNNELESFSYSVSHDLRAPLRSIDGYTQILMEDYAPQMDAEGNRLLSVVVTNARRMARLIDDLLDFSRIGRKEIASSRIQTAALVESVVNELKVLEPERDMTIKVSPLHDVDGDSNLMRQVWMNLVSNAMKYTRKKEKALIEISSKKEPGEVVFMVKDNGTGFDMQYAPKLFGVFQRLHRQNEFEGTGVGLAIVHRIVSRHGGRIWAEAEAGKGATFYFSLPVTINV